MIAFIQINNQFLLWTSRAVLIVTLPYSVTYENRPYHLVRLA